jgi:hypothetical protein
MAEFVTMVEYVLKGNENLGVNGVREIPAVAGDVKEGGAIILEERESRIRMVGTCSVVWFGRGREGGSGAEWSSGDGWPCFVGGTALEAYCCAIEGPRALHGALRMQVSGGESWFHQTLHHCRDVLVASFFLLWRRAGGGARKLFGRSAPARRRQEQVLCSMAAAVVIPTGRRRHAGTAGGRDAIANGLRRQRGGALRCLLSLLSLPSQGHLLEVGSGIGIN